MPTRKVNKGKGRSFDQGDGISEDFHLVNTSASDGSGKLSIPLSPLIADILSNQANNFAYYRFTKFKFRIMPNATSSQVEVASCFYAGVPDATPGTVTAITGVKDSTYLSKAMTIPSAWVSVPRVTLSGKQPWYKAVAGSPESVEEIQGYILFVCSTATANITYEFRGKVQFKDQVDSSATPPLSVDERLCALNLLNAKVQERQRLAQEKSLIRQRQHALIVLANTAHLGTCTATK